MGAAARMRSQPVSVMTANWPRWSVSQRIRVTQPERSMRVIWWVSLLRDANVARARSAIRTRPSGDSDSCTRISYSPKPISK